jgi:hypothetical protein
VRASSDARARTQAIRGERALAAALAGYEGEAVRATLLATVLAAVVAVALAACGSSSKPAYCADRENLQQSINALTHVDLKEGGVAALQTQLREVEGDAKALAASAQAEFGPQATALKSSVSTLAGTVEKAVSSPSAESFAAVANNLSQAKTAFDDLSGAVSSKC